MKNLMTAISKVVRMLGIVVFGLIVLVALPAITSAQGRGRGRDKDFERRDKDFEKSERKRDKFVNGHDARDGRWDGRGPSRFRQRYDDDNFRRFRRQRQRDNDDSWRRRSHHNRRWNSYNDNYRRTWHQRNSWR